MVAPNGKGLGIVRPPDEKHLERYPLNLTPELMRTPRPVHIGLSFHALMDQFVDHVDDQGRKWSVMKAKPRKLGALWGGHAMALMPWSWVGDPNKDDLPQWHADYDQGQTPECGPFSGCRIETLYNRVEYAPDPVYQACKQIDGLNGEDGTTLRAVWDVLRTKGAPLRDTGEWTGPLVSENQWIMDIDTLDAVLGGTNGLAPLLQSWGTQAPERILMPMDTLHYLYVTRREYMEATCWTDLPNTK